MRNHEKRVSAGDFVRNGPMFVIIQPNPLKLRFTVPEKDVEGSKQIKKLCLEWMALRRLNLRKSEYCFPTLKKRQERFR